MASGIAKKPSPGPLPPRAGCAGAPRSTGRASAAGKFLVIHDRASCSGRRRTRRHAPHSAIPGPVANSISVRIVSGRIPPAIRQGILVLSSRACRGISVWSRRLAIGEEEGVSPCSVAFCRPACGAIANHPDFPRHGKYSGGFSTPWKTFFHTVENPRNIPKSESVSSVKSAAWLLGRIGYWVHAVRTQSHVTPSRAVQGCFFSSASSTAVSDPLPASAEGRSSISFSRQAGSVSAAAAKNRIASA